MTVFVSFLHGIDLEKEWEEKGMDGTTRLSSHPNISNTFPKHDKFITGKWATYFLTLESAAVLPTQIQRREP
jgi:hypothetical protein